MIGGMRTNGVELDDLGMPEELASTSIRDDIDFLKENYKKCFGSLEIESKNPENDSAVFTLAAKQSASKVRVELSRQHFLVLETLDGPDLTGQTFENLEQLLSKMDNYPGILFNLVSERLRAESEKHD